MSKKILKNVIVLFSGESKSLSLPRRYHSKSKAMSVVQTNEGNISYVTKTPNN